jgi:hypothetical protein
LEWEVAGAEEGSEADLGWEENPTLTNYCRQENTGLISGNLALEAVSGVREVPVRGDSVVVSVEAVDLEVVSEAGVVDLVEVVAECSCNE